ncbi:MAG: HD domain-containing protein [Chloroflexi bacterium]|nr:HD domain-containing protein [Chloroflexota bacterium]
MPNRKLEALVTHLVASPRVQSLWHISDRGVPVFVHTIDVTMLCLEKFPEWREKFPSFSLEATTIGSLLHDLSKASTRFSGQISHSALMSTAPDRAVREAMDVLDEAQSSAGFSLESEQIDHIWHIIASHHGRWGKVMPSTPEALLVHQMDYFSATYHRCSPVDANDILPFVRDGLKMVTVAARLGVGTSVVRDRLKEACRAEGVRDSRDLLKVWESRGSVVCGSLERMERVEYIRGLKELALQAPRPILEAIARARQPG